MNRVEYLLTKLAEECAEVAQRATKALCFGLDEIQPGQPLNNRQRIEHELTDLTVILDMLIDAGALKDDPIPKEEFAMRRAKVERFMEYSRKCGTLQDRGPSDVPPGAVSSRHESEQPTHAPARHRSAVRTEAHGLPAATHPLRPVDGHAAVVGTVETPPVDAEPLASRNPVAVSIDEEIRAEYQKAARSKWKAALMLVSMEPRVSIAMIQRRLEVGYNVASEIMIALEHGGYVGPAPKDGHLREVLKRP